MSLLEAGRFPSAAQYAERDMHMIALSDADLQVQKAADSHCLPALPLVPVLPLKSICAASRMLICRRNMNATQYSISPTRQQNTYVGWPK